MKLVIETVLDMTEANQAKRVAVARRFGYKTAGGYSDGVVRMFNATVGRILTIDTDGNYTRS